MTLVASLRSWNDNIWQLFIDYLQQSLKAVLLHNGNSKPPILIAHCGHLEETHDYMKILLKAVQYNVHQWNNCGDLKVTSMSMAMQADFIKFCCLCLWDSCSKPNIMSSVTGNQGRLISWEKIVSNSCLSHENIPFFSPYKTLVDYVLSESYGQDTFKWILIPEWKISQH